MPRARLLPLPSPLQAARLLLAFAALVVAAGVLGAGGCATRVQTATTDPALGEALDGGARVAIGPVTVAPTLGATLAPADSADALAACYRAFLTARPDLTIWPADAVAGQADPAALAAVAASHARLGRPDPAAVRTLADDLPGSRFLALVRLEDDEVRSNAVRQDMQDPEARAAGVPEHGSGWSQTVLVERELTVGLTLVDLQTGEVAFAATAEARDRQRYAYESPLGEDPAATVQERLADAGQPRYLSRRGEALQTPDLVALVEQALEGLVARLPARATR
jgi:hypothetical protein